MFLSQNTFFCCFRKTNPDIPLDYFFGGPLFSDGDIPIETPLHGIWLILNGLDRQGFTIAARAIAGVGEATGT